VITLFGKFLSRTTTVLLGHAVGKKIDFGHLNFTFYSLLEKEHLYCFTFSHKLPAKHNVRSLPLEKENKNNDNQHCFTHVHFMLACWIRRC